MSAFNRWQADPKKPTYVGTHYKARLYIPMEVNGKVVALCPDTGHTQELPKKITETYESN